MDKAEREAAVAWTREQLTEILQTLKKIEATAPQSMLDVLEIAEHLTDLSSSDDSWRQQAEGLGDLSLESLRRAAMDGLAGSTEAHSDHSPYIQLLKEHLKQTESSAKHFDALCIFAASCIDRGELMPFELRLFVSAILKNEVTRPSQRGSPPIHPARDKLLYALLLDIVERFSIPATRGRNEPERVSACDILSEAMSNRARLPTSFISIERIFIAGNKLADT